MANESKPENVDDNSVTNGSRTSFIISSTPTRNSQEDNSTASAVQDTTESRFFLPPWGTVFCIMASFGFCCAFTLRVSLSVAIVAMVNQTAISDDHVVTTNISDTDQCPRDQELERADGELTWDRHQQGTALAAFYYGLIVTQIPGGWLADRFGGKRLFGGCVLLSSVISLLSPVAARAHLGVFVMLRVISGLGNGVLYPALHALIARWSAPRSRSLVTSLIFFGAPAGIVAGMLLSGVLCDYGFAGGWPSVFYVFGMVGCVWSFAWFLLCYDSPATHPRLSRAERQYWEKVIGTTDLSARPPTPWRKMLTSVPVWALAVAYFANDWSAFTVISCIPLFMHDVLGFDMTKNGTFSALPFVLATVMIPTGLCSDWLRYSSRLSTTVIRKIFCVTGFVLTACMLIVVGYAGCNRALAVAVLFIAVGCMHISVPVVVTNQLDLAPLHAGKIMGLTHFVAIVAQITAPHVIGALTYHRSTRFEWQIIFFLAAGIYAVGAIVFGIFGSGKIQSWAGMPDVYVTSVVQQLDGATVRQSDM